MWEKYSKMTKSDLRNYIADLISSFLELRIPMYDSLVEMHKEKTTRPDGFPSSLHASMSMITQGVIEILEDMRIRGLLLKKHAVVLEQLKSERQEIKDILAKERNNE